MVLILDQKLLSNFSCSWSKKTHIKWSNRLMFETPFYSPIDLFRPFCFSTFIPRPTIVRARVLRKEQQQQKPLTLSSFIIGTVI